MIHKGSCHCGAVRYEVEAPADLEVSECNCSICSRSGYLHLIVPKDKFHLHSGADNLTSYSFDTQEAKHLFCKTCGIKSFYIPRSHPDGVSVNVRCLDGTTIKSINITPFDGRNWEDNIHKLKPLSHDKV
ncbi:MAG TPA: GFA family protein [Gammaproteobacteria bacterium]